MENNVYDNGQCLLGTLKAIREYTISQLNEENTEELTAMLDQLKDFSGDLIVMVKYDLPIGYDIEIWSKGDVLK